MLSASNRVSSLDTICADRYGATANDNNMTNTKRLSISAMMFDFSAAKLVIASSLSKGQIK
jgi:hypothetical protein